MLPERSWFQYAEQALVAIFSASVALSLRSTSASSFQAIQGFCAAASLLACGAYLRVAPWGRAPAQRQAWKNHAGAGLLLLSAVTALTSFFQASASARGSGGSDSSPDSASGLEPWALGLTPLLLAPLLVLAIFVSWLRSLLHEEQDAAEQKERERVEALRAAAALQATVNPLAAAAAAHRHGAPAVQQGEPGQALSAPPAFPPFAASAWQRTTDEDGDSFFVHSSSGLSAWRWLFVLDHRAEAHFYVDLQTGAQSWEKPPLAEGPDELGWERVWDAAEQRFFWWHGRTVATEWEASQARG
jgi:hypothetical protein